MQILQGIDNVFSYPPPNGSRHESATLSTLQQAFQPQLPNQLYAEKANRLFAIQGSTQYGQNPQPHSAYIEKDIHFASFANSAKSSSTQKTPFDLSQYKSKIDEKAYKILSSLLGSVSLGLTSEEVEREDDLRDSS